MKPDWHEHALAVGLSRFLAATLALFMTIPIFAAPPTSQPARPGYRLVDRQWISTTRIDSWQKLLSVTIVEGQLQFSLAPEKKLQPQFTGGRRVAAEVGDSPLVWVLSYSDFNAGNSSARGTYLRGVGLPAAPVSDDHYRLSAVLIEPTGAIIRGEGKINNRNISCEVRQDRVKSFLSVRIVDQTAGEQPRGLQANAVDIRMLLLEHGDAMQIYVVPLLNELAGSQILRPRAADVYRVYPDIPATPRGHADLAVILQALSDRDPMVRRQAETQLDASGDEVVLAAMRATGLNAPQEAAVRRFLSRRQLLLDTQIERMREELSYQIDLLDFDDRVVRERAKHKIELITAEKISFDLDLEGSQRTAAVDQFRLLLTTPLD